MRANILFGERMKILDEQQLDLKESDRIEKEWSEASRQIGLEHGVFVEVKKEYRGGTVFDDVLSRIYFKVGEHEFESLRELKRACRLKAFL